MLICLHVYAIWLVGLKHIHTFPPSTKSDQKVLSCSAPSICSSVRLSNYLSTPPSLPLCSPQYCTNPVHIWRNINLSIMVSLMFNFSDPGAITNSMSGVLVLIRYRSTSHKISWIMLIIGTVIDRIWDMAFIDYKVSMSISWNLFALWNTRNNYTASN